MAVPTNPYLIPTGKYNYHNTRNHIEDPRLDPVYSERRRPMERRRFLVSSLGGFAAGTAFAAACSSQAQDPTSGQAGTPAPDPGSAAKPAGPPPLPTLGPQPPDGRQFSYAQQGEDLIVLQALTMLGIGKPSYLDVGAFHPMIGSNTYLMYAAGGRGVLVEPNPAMTKMLAEVRPKDVVVNAGVGIGEATEADYYLIKDRPQLNTFSKAQVDRYVAEGGTLEKTVPMKLERIDALIESHFKTAPDFLSIDVEGLDLEILQTMNFDKHRPTVLCVESAVYGTTGLVRPLIEFMRAKGYAVRGGSMINTMFVDEARLEAKAPDGATLTF
ncbi:MAG: FkbM family methyltransferase [Myxococcota bacterium]